MLSLRTSTGRVSWPLLATVLAAQFAALYFAWMLTHSSWLQGVLLLACFFPLRALSVQAADTNPFPIRTASETQRRELLLIVGFLTLLAASAGLSQSLKASSIYPGLYAVVYLTAWVPLTVAWNSLGYQR